MDTQEPLLKVGIAEHLKYFLMSDRDRLFCNLLEFLWFLPASDWQSTQLPQVKIE